MRLATHDVVELAEVAHVVCEGSRVERRKTPIPVSQRLHRLVELLSHSQFRPVPRDVPVLIEQDAVARGGVVVTAIGVDT
jgi:hypothetical protein